VAVLDQGMDLAYDEVDAASKLTVAWCLYSCSLAKVACTPGSGGRSGSVVSMAWMPGFPSQEMIATSFCFFVDTAAAFFSAGRGYFGHYSTVLDCAGRSALDAIIKNIFQFCNNQKIICTVLKFAIFE
jgi:hypothetical protein